MPIVHVTKRSKIQWEEFSQNHWNPVRGKCSHDCKYCNTDKDFNKGIISIIENEIEKDLGENNFIFVCSMTDLFTDDTPIEIIERVISKCNSYPTNKYLFQTKNPERYEEFNNILPESSMYGITLESNRIYPGTYAPSPVSRVNTFSNLLIKRKMVSIEPIMDFDIVALLGMVKEIKPRILIIGADNNHSNLIEPSVTKTKMFINEIKRLLPLTLIVKRNNLFRLLEGNIDKDARPIYTDVE